MLSQGEGCERRRGEREGGGGSKHVKGTINHQLYKFTRTWARMLSDRNIFCPLRRKEKNSGVQCPSGFSCYPAVRTGSSNTHFFPWFFTPPSGRGLVIPVFFFFCRRGHLPQTSARSKQYLPVMCVRLAFIRQNFHESWCRKLLAI